MAHGILGLDHALIGVRDLAAARAAWERLGFTTTPLGRHAGRATGNHCLMFPGNYVELIGVVDPAGPPSRLTRLLAERGESVIGAALAAASADAAHASFAASGLAPEPVAELRRPSERGELRFRLVELPPQAAPDLRLFVCEHETPGLLRRPEWLDHPNGATGLRSLVVVVDDPVARQAGLERLFGAGSTAATDDLVTVFVGRCRLLFATEADFAFLHPQLELAPGPVPRGAALSVEVRDLDRAARLLERNGVDFAEAADVLSVAPEAASGVVLSLVPARS